jgi:DMSO/TMAO reductase YedYZ molybdopterin-dependent catalytic subunit
VSIDEKNIGRRTFIGLILAGIVALFVGKDVLSFITQRGTSSGGSTPSGGTSSGGIPAGFRINTVKDGPAFDPATWHLTVDGLVGTPLNFTFSQFTDLPQTTVTRDFYCVEGWGVTGAVWKGVAVKELMQRAQIDRAATHLVFHSGDGVYADSLTLEQSAFDDTLLVHELDGAPLPPEMGQPLRLLYPGHYGYKYVKWAERVEAIDASQTPFTGYWEGYGYSADATIPGALN